jgi:hypothetical protein
MTTLVKFTNPITAGTYTWEVNPSADNEQPLSKARQITRTSNTADVGAVKQQGDDGPLILDWQINVPTRAMATALWEWYVLCRTQTIYVTDWDSDEYEGQLIFVSRARKVGNPPYSVCETQFEVWRLISGVLFDAGVTP